jgi:hypothetical protein
MSISIKSAAATLAVFALAAAVSLASSAALANTKGTGAGGGQRPAPGGAAGQKSEPRVQKKCYWLPTVANGTVTGVHAVCS